MMPSENSIPPVVHIVDDDPQVRAATSYLLASHGYAPQAYASGAELLDSASLGRGCILLDLQLEDRSGFEVLAELTARGTPTPVIMISGRGGLAAAVKAIKLGAEDFLEKPCPERDLIAAIERALDADAKRRDRSDSHAVAVARLARLSPRERQILQGLLAGMTNKQIARHLGLSPRAVEMHRASMMDDLQLNTLAQALRLAVDAQLTPFESDEPEQPFLLPRHARRSAPKQATLGEPIPPAVLDILEGTTECVFLLDRAWNFIYLNRNAAATIARGRSLLGAVIWEAFPLAVGTRAWEQMQKAAADRQAVRFSFFEPDLERWFDVNVRPVHSGLQVFFRDITSERHTQAALKLSEEALHLALDASGHGAWDWNIATGEVTMSARFLERLGYAPTGVPGRFDAVLDLVHPADLAVFQARLDDHFEGRSDSFACEYRLRRHDGSWCWNFDQGRIIARDPISGNPARMVGTASDITDRKLEEGHAREAFERLALAQDNAGAGVWDLDLQLRRVRMDRRCLAMHGLPANADSELPEAQWEAQVHPDDLASVHRAMNSAITTGSVYRVQYRTIAADGRCRWVLGLGRMVATNAASPARFVGLGLDITESMVVALELKRVRAEMEYLSRVGAIGPFAATLAHELSQPLTSISNFAGGLRRCFEKPGDHDIEAAMRAIEGVERSALHAAHVMRRVRDQSQGSTFERRVESLRSMIEETGYLRGDTLSTAASLDYHVDPAAEFVLVDRVQIEQVLLNLIRNACEAMTDSGVPGRITVAAEAVDGFALVRLCDTGAGLSAARKGGLFSPIASSKAQGSGIGLSICRTIVEAHQGRIWAEDNRPCGACLCFTLPLAAP